MRVVIVTGAGNGTGKASAQALLQDGYCVVLAGRRMETLEQTAAQSGAGERVGQNCSPCDYHLG